MQIFTMGAARLAGGFLRPIDPDDLKVAVRELLAKVQLGELEPIKNLPGMVRAAVVAHVERAVRAFLRREGIDQAFATESATAHLQAEAHERALLRRIRRTSLADLRSAFMRTEQKQKSFRGQWSRSIVAIVLLDLFAAHPIGFPRRRSRTRQNLA